MKYVIIVLVLLAVPLLAQVDTTAIINAAQSQLWTANSMYFTAKTGITDHGGANDSIRVVIGQPGTAYWIPVGGGARSFYNTTIVDYWKAQRKAAIDTLNKYKDADK